MKRLTKSFTFNGKRYFVHAYTEKELEQKVIDKKIELQTFQPSNRTMESWSYEVYETYKHVKQITYNSYMYRLNNFILKYIGNKRVKDVSPLDCQKLLNNLTSQYMINQVAIMLRFIFDKAIDNGLIERNPANNLCKPKGTVQERQSLTADQTYTFLKAYEDKFLIFYVMYYTGCRPSEASNLLGSDIENNILHIRGTKNKTSDRYVPIPNELLQKIKNTAPTEHICLTRTGLVFDKHRISDLWSKFKVATELPNEATPYWLRHTYCTNLLSKGTDLRICQYLMGHSSLDMIPRYTHITKDFISSMKW